MAATWIKPLHVRKDRTILQSIMGRTAYAMNQEKMDGGVPVIGYACDPRTVDEEFLLAKKEYEYLTGRDNGNKNVIAYHIRQSFKPGEVTPAEAQQAGYELAMRFTKGKHAFIVAVHTDRAHTHCAIVVNSTRLDCRGKFNNFRNSSLALRRLSDIICAERGLSIIENPKPSKGENYAEWLGGKEPSWQEKLRGKIDEVLPSCPTFGDFIAAMKSAGYKVNEKRKHITFLASGQGKPTRLDTLKGEHTEAAIRERLAGTRTVPPRVGKHAGASNKTGQGNPGSPGGNHTSVNLLIDIQAKIRDGKGAGYENWARIFNLKEKARTLLFLKENGIDSYDGLAKRSSSASSEFSALTKKIKDVEERMSAISETQKHIGAYGKTRDVYKQYLNAKNRGEFFEGHRAEITLHTAAKKYFNESGYGKDKKLPAIADLKQEYAALAAEKKKLYSGYRSAKSNAQDLLVAKGNADRMLGIKAEGQIQSEAPRERKAKRDASK